MHKAMEVVVDLYTNSAMNRFIDGLREGVFPHLTDTVTLFAALIAIALPLAQQTFQWASDKYNSEHLVEYVETNSPAHPKALSTSLILYVAVSFMFKLLSTSFNDFLFISLLIGLVFWFAVNIALLIPYFAYTYEMGKGLKAIRKRILSQNLNLEREMYTAVEVSLLSDFEVYQLEHNSHVGDFSPEFSELRLIVGRRSTKLDESVVSAYLSGLRRSVVRLPSTVSDRKYNFVTQNFIFLVQALVCKHNKYLYLLNELVETAETVEPYRKGSAKPLLQGLVFQNITYSNDWPEGLDRALVQHFGRLTLACIETDEKEQIVHLYKEFNKSLGFSAVNKSELQYHFYSDLESYEDSSLVCKLINSIIESSDHVSQELIEIRLGPYLKGTSDEKRKSIEEFCRNLRNYRYQEKANIAVEELLSRVAKVDLSIVLAIRETRKPISSNVNILGYDLLPLNIDSVMIRISKIGSKVEERIFREDKFEQHILTAYVALFVYEITRVVKNCIEIQNNTEQWSYQYINQMSFLELNKVKQKIAEINNILGYVIGSECFSQLFYLHGVNPKDVTTKSEEYLSGLLLGVDMQIDMLSTSGELDSVSLQRFKGTIPSGDEVAEKYAYIFSNKVKLSQYARYRYNIPFNRTAFLPDTGVFQAFGSAGWDVVDGHFRKIFDEIAKAREGMRIVEVWPVNYGRLILIHFKQECELKKHGFKFVKGKMFWPNGSSCTYAHIRDDSETFVNILPSETLVQVTNLNDSLFEVEFTDKGKELEWSFTFNIMPYGFKY